MKKTTNKLISLLLAAIMLLSTSVTAFSAEAEQDYTPDALEYDYEIAYGKDLAVTVESGSEVCVKFVPEKSGKYIFRTESDGVDTGAVLVDSTGEEVGCEYNDDDAETFDFRIIYEFEGGEVYYLKIFTYSENTETFELVIECGHVFEDGTCTICDKVCDHTEIGFLGFCICGEKFISEAVSNGEETEVEFESTNEFCWFVFAPEVSGTYLFESFSESCDPDCFLYDSVGTMLYDSYDVNGMDFYMVYYFEAGELYYFYVNNCYGEGTVKLALNRLVHTAADGSEHDLEFVEGTYSNCTEHGYSDGLYCAICEIYVSGHEEMPLDEEYHIDEDYDEICDLCGEGTSWEEEVCEHICHSENTFWSIIWRIANFFHSLFGILPLCECGEWHY